MICVGQDITQIREVTKEQDRVADGLSRLIESANAPIFGVDLSGMVTEWNLKAASISGFTKQETIGRNLVQNFIQPDYKESVSDVLNDALIGKRLPTLSLCWNRSMVTPSLCCFMQPHAEMPKAMAQV